MISVACISVSSALGGSEWSLLEFARRAAANDIDVAVLIPKEGPLGDQLRAANVKVRVAAAPSSLLELTQREMISIAGLFTLSAGLASWARTIRRVALETFGGPPAVLYSNGFKAHLAASLVRGPKRVWHLREFPPEQTQVVWKLLVGALPTAAIANSRAVSEAWQVAGFRAPAVVLNGVDLERFAPTPKTGWIHEALGLDPSARLIGMPAVFARWKGHLQVVEAFERAAADVEDANLVLVGGAIYDTKAERGFAEELVKRVGRASVGGGGGSRLTNRIHFLKHTAEPWKLYPEFDTVVHFSTRPEPFGRVVAEALASGVPVIAARAGGPLEIVRDGETGWLVTPGDTSALASAMSQALRLGESGTAAMRKAARADAEARFGADRYAAEVSAVLKGVAK